MNVLVSVTECGPCCSASGNALHCVCMHPTGPEWMQVLVPEVHKPMSSLQEEGTWSIQVASSAGCRGLCPRAVQAAGHAGAGVPQTLTSHHKLAL